MRKVDIYYKFNCMKVN